MRAALCLPLLSLFLVLVDGSGQAAPEDDQCSLLVKFQQQMSEGVLWNDGCSDGWWPRNTTPDCCSWNDRTIRCDANGKLTILNMAGCGIQGQFTPGESIFRVDSLEELYLDNQKGVGKPIGIYGKLPDVDVPLARSLTKFTAYQNSLNGSLEMFGGLENLEHVALTRHGDRYTASSRDGRI